MHVTITGVPRNTTGTGEKVDKLIVPFVQALRDAYVAAKISDDESATLDLLTDILVYASKVESTAPAELADRAASAARAELHEAAADALYRDK